jgi:integrative and conjugative element protein (TIGR02256 family)
MISRYQISEAEHVVFSKDVLGIFQSHIQTSGRKESGGILLGCVYPGSHTLIDIATRPGAFDKAGLRYFDRSRKRAQRIVEREWDTSGGTRVYLGEWHTHSELHPSPSMRDRQMIHNMFQQTTMEIDFLFLAIIGIRSNWVGIQDGKRLRRLQALKEE